MRKRTTVSLILLTGVACLLFLGASPAKMLPARVTQQADVPYPEISKVLGEEGITWIKILVTAEGKARQAQVVQSSGSAALDERARQIALRSRYEAARQHGKRIQSWLALPIASTLPEKKPGNQKQIDILKQKTVQSNDPKLYGELGLLYLEEERWTEAKKAFHKALELDAQNPEYWSSLGDAELGTREFLPAKSHFEKALALSPASTHATAGLAKAHLSMGKREEALSLYMKIAKETPEDPAISATVGNLLVSLNRFDEALPYLEQARSRNPENLSVLQNLAYLYFQQGAYLKAAEIYQTLFKQAPENATLAVNLGSTLLYAGKAEEAIPVLEKAVALDPKRPGARYSLGLAYLDKNQFQKAESLLRDAVALMEAEHAPPSTLASAYMELGVAQVQAGNKEEGIRSSQKAASLAPRNANVLLALGQAYESAKLLDKAIPVYEQVALLFPELPESHERLGYLHYAKKDWIRAKESWRQALEIYKRRNNKAKVNQISENLRVLEEKNY